MVRYDEGFCVPAILGLTSQLFEGRRDMPGGSPLITDNDGRPVVLLGVQWVGLSQQERREVITLLNQWVEEQWRVLNGPKSD